MIRHVMTAAIGVAIGAMFRDPVLNAVSNAKVAGRPPAPGRRTRPDRGVRTNGRPPSSVGERAVDGGGASGSNAEPAVTLSGAGGADTSFRSLTQCFDDLYADYAALEDQINDYGNDHPGAPEAMRLVWWWGKLGLELDQLVRDTVLNDPEVIRSIALIRRNSEELTAVSEEFGKATADVQKLNRALSLVSALVSLFKA